MSALRVERDARPARTGRTAAPRRSRRRPKLSAAPEPRTRGRRWPFLLISAVLVVSLVVAVVSAQALVAQTSFRMRDLTKRTAELRHAYDDLRLQVAHLSAPARIAEEANSRGLVLPDPSTVQSVQVREPAGSTVPAPPPSGYAVKRLTGEGP